VAPGGVSELIEKLELVTNAYAESIANASLLRQDLDTDPVTGNDHFAYHADNAPSILSGLVTLGTITPEGVVTTDVSAVVTDAQDSHNFFSLMTDGAGDLLLSGDMHGGDMHWARLTGGSINFTAWATPPIESGATDEASVTYPKHAARLANGDVLFFFRDGGSGEANLVLKKWIAATDTLVAVNGAGSIIVDGEGAESFYPHVPYLTADGDILIGGCWRVTTDLNTNHDQIFARLSSSDGWDTCTATKADGSAQTLPITRANADTAAVIAQNTGLTNVGSITVNAAGHPIMWSFRDPGDGISQLFALRWDGAAWNNHWIPDDPQLQSGIPFSYVGVTGGANTTPFSSPRAICDGVTDRTIILMRSDSVGTGVYALICERSDLTQWVWHLLDSTDVGFWFGAESPTAWRTLGEIRTTVQRCKFPAEATIGPQTLSRLRFRPKSAAYEYTAPTALFDPDDYAGCVAYAAPRVGGLTVYGKADDADIDKVLAVKDARDQSALYVQATRSDAPSLVWDHFGARKGGVLFVSANSDFMLSTDATTLAALNGTNVPLFLCTVVQFSNVTAAQCYWGAGDTGGSNTKYMRVGITAAGLTTFERRVGGGAVKQYTGSSALVAGTKYVISAVFDGTNGYMRVNGVQQGAAVDMTFATASTWTHLSYGVRRRTASNDLYFDGYKGAEPVYTTIPSAANIAAIENALAAEHGITF
jgi:hypothetical protein